MPRVNKHPCSRFECREKKREKKRGYGPWFVVEAYIRQLWVTDEKEPGTTVPTSSRFCRAIAHRYFFNPTGQ